MRTDAITNFWGAHAFLSNFDMADFAWRNDAFPTGEHAFSFAKGYFINGTGSEQQAHFDAVLNAVTPNEAKKLGRQVKIGVEEWDAHKVQYMREIVHAKFLGVPGLAGQLINTGASMLVEGNTWGDRVWGRVYEDGKWTGKNLLGVILMEERGYWLRGEL